MVRAAAAFDRLGADGAFPMRVRAAELVAAGRDIVDLSSGRPEFATPEHVVEAAVRALRDGHHGRTDPRGLPELREAVCAHVAGTIGAHVAADRVMILPGAGAGVFAAISMFGEPGVDILYPDPGFPVYRSLIEYTGARAVPVPLREGNGFGLAAAELLSLITPATRLVILNSPANPTGGVSSPAEVNRLVAGLLDHPGVAVLSDEVYDRMVYDGAEHRSLLSFPEIRNRLIMVNGWSMSYAMTGWRLAWSVWPTSLVDRVRRLVANSWGGVNTAAQYAGMAALAGPQDSVGEMVTELDRRRRLILGLLAGLPGVSCVEPGGAFYAFPNITATGWDSGALAGALLERAGVALLSGADFGAGGEGHLRVSYATGEENIRTAMLRMGDFLTEYG
jgi:aspartate/methionine/tyrosine aminotransferase